MNRVKAIAKLIGYLVYFSVALFLVTIGAGAAMGALTGDWVTGVVVMFGGGLIVVSGEIGRTMIRKITVEIRDLQRAFIKASDTIEEQQPKK